MQVFRSRVVMTCVPLRLSAADDKIAIVKCASIGRSPSIINTSHQHPSRHSSTTFLHTSHQHPSRHSSTTFLHTSHQHPSRHSSTTFLHTSHQHPSRHRYTA